MSVPASTPTSPRAVVKIEDSIDKPGWHLAVCHTGTCSWTNGPHVVKAAATEQANWHRQQHRGGQITSSGARP